MLVNICSRRVRAQLIRQMNLAPINKKMDKALEEVGLLERFTEYGKELRLTVLVSH